jgi:uncharacterized membrane protein YcaP (DUF421 family)
MDILIRGLAVYVFLLVVFRIGGKRSLSQATTFDFVLLLIIAETTQQALVGDDWSITTAFLLIALLVGLDILLSVLKCRYQRVDQLIEGVPMIIVRDGHPLRERMTKERIDEEDILFAARASQGLERMDQIKYAVLERNGRISIIRKAEASHSPSMSPSA